MLAGTEAKVERPFGEPSRTGLEHLERLGSLAAVLYTLADVRSLLPVRASKTPWSREWVRTKLAEFGAHPRYLGREAMWLREEVEAALPHLVRTQWKRRRAVVGRT